MPWMTFWVCALSCAVMGCPEVHRRDGLVDRAAHQDALENIPTRCSSVEREQYCSGEASKDPECIRRCGEAE
ncbi:MULTISPECIES: hypothetical protein [unclassified Myxococcus]|uniref:hypothetical protein n=2 Tax=Myxococcus TaxID=32 RepID=UPI00157B8359|nr:MULTISPECIES: hypothetical protein [unclassified Myxococcus]NTX06168.1 hypothetical protein [Myxococcus sp. CA040A]